MSVHFTITPGIENRLSSWNNFAQKRKEEEQKPPLSITLSREFGCQAYPVAELLEQRLNAKEESDNSWIVLDRKLLEKLAEDSGFSKTEVDQVSSTSPIFQSMISMFMGQHRAEQFEIFTYIKKAVRHFAGAGRCIIVGRGASALTQDFSNCLHIRLVAPLNFRVKVIMERLNMEEAEARQHIKTQQKHRDDFIHHFTKDSVADPSMYHLVFNNARNTPEQIATLIEQYIELRNTEA